MSRVCDLTGKRAMVGNNVSHVFLAEEDRWVTLRVAASTIKTINKNGLASVLKTAKANGFIK